MHNDDSTYPLFDIGVNLFSTQFDKQRTSLIERAAQAGVGAMIAIASDVGESIRLRESKPINHPSIWHTAGVHPHQAKTFDSLTIQTLELCLTDDRCVAVGECGLDFNRMFSTETEQVFAFQEQIELANRIDRPLYLHQRDAHDAFTSILSSMHPGGLVDGVIHCFTEDRKMLRTYLDFGLYIGVTGWVCDERRGDALREALTYIPHDRLLLETDAPYLKPRGYQGRFKTKRNEPCLLPFIAQYVAHEIGQPVDTLIQQTTDNAQKLFRLKPIHTGQS